MLIDRRSCNLAQFRLGPENSRAVTGHGKGNDDSSSLSGARATLPLGINCLSPQGVSVPVALFQLDSVLLALLLRCR